MTKCKYCNKEQEESNFPIVEISFMGEKRKFREKICEECSRQISVEYPK